MAVLDGRELAKKLTEQMKEKLRRVTFARAWLWCLWGDDPASQLYVKLKEKAAKHVGIHFERHERPASTSEDDVLRLCAV